MATFCMMVGLPGSGKSHLSGMIMRQNHSRGIDTVVHASDAICAEILGNESDQSQRHKVFDVLHQRVKDDLRAGKYVIYDATNISYKRRMAFLIELDALHIEHLYRICVFMATPFEQCLENNCTRERIVPEDVIRRMRLSFDVPMREEGWNCVVPYNTPDYVAGNMDRKLKELCRIGQDSHHHSLTVGQHCLAAWGYLHEHYPEASNILSRATLLHDLGKESTKAFLDSKGEPSEEAHFYNHERVGAYDSFSYTGDMSEQERMRVALLIRWHMLPFVISHSENPAKTEAKFRRLLGDNVWKNIQILHECDMRAH